MIAIRRLITIVLILVLMQVSISCMATINPSEYTKHYQEQADLTMIDGSRYTLARNWTIDSNYCIRGRARITKNDSSKIGNVNIPISGISRLSVEDNITPVYFELIIASAVFIHMLN